jgi:hypothetical protein
MRKNKGENPVAIRVAKHRHGLRTEGLKPAQVWVIDTTTAKAQRAVSTLCLSLNAVDLASGDAEFAYALSQDDE